MVRNPQNTGDSEQLRLPYHEPGHIDLHETPDVLAVAACIDVRNFLLLFSFDSVAEDVENT